LGPLKTPVCLYGKVKPSNSKTQTKLHHSGDTTFKD
jgi:hypothetical protein